MTSNSELMAICIFHDTALPPVTCLPHVILQTRETVSVFKGHQFRADSQLAVLSCPLGFPSTTSTVSEALRRVALFLFPLLLILLLLLHSTLGWKTGLRFPIGVYVQRGYEVHPFSCPVHKGKVKGKVVPEPN